MAFEVSSISPIPFVVPLGVVWRRQSRLARGVAGWGSAYNYFWSAALDIVSMLNMAWLPS